MTISASVTVITPTIVGREHMLAECVASVTGQSVRPSGGHLVGPDVDGQGPGAVRNQLAAQADTEWYAWLDDDDRFYPHHLATLLDVSDDADVVWSIPHLIGDWPAEIAAGLAHRCDAVELLPVRNTIPVTCLVRAATFHAVGGFPARCGSVFEDWALNLALTAVGARFRCVHDRTWVYRWHGENRTVGPLSP